MSSLHDLLLQEKELLDRFIACLREETAALKEIRPDTLNTIGQEKLALSSQLDTIENRRSALTGAHGGNGGRAAMQQWLDRHPQEAAAAALWNEILALATEAKRLHNLNGELIAIHLSKTSEAIEILSRRQRDKPLYGSDGQSTSSSGSRIVDSA